MTAFTLRRSTFLSLSLDPVAAYNKRQLDVELLHKIKPSGGCHHLSMSRKTSHFRHLPDCNHLVVSAGPSGVRGAHAPPGGTSVDVGRGRPLVVDDKGVGHEEIQSKPSRQPNRLCVYACVFVTCAGLFLPATEFSFILFTRLFFCFVFVVCLSDALRLNLRTENNLLSPVVNRKKWPKYFQLFFSIRIISRRFFMWEKKSVNLCRSLIAVKHLFGGRSRTRKERTDCHLCY